MSFSPGCATGTPHNLIKVTQCVISPDTPEFRGLLSPRLSLIMGSGVRGVLCQEELLTVLLHPAAGSRAAGVCAIWS